MLFRSELVKRIRQVTGAEDPDADPENPDPEAKARAEAKKLMQAMQQRGAEAELADKEATASEKQAKARKATIEADKIAVEIGRILADTAGANVDMQVRAMEAAAAILGARPGTANIADAVLSEAGFQGATPPAPPMAEQPPMQPEQMAPPEPEPMPMEQGGGSVPPPMPEGVMP